MIMDESCPANCYPLMSRSPVSHPSLLLHPHLDKVRSHAMSHSLPKRLLSARTLALFFTFAIFADMVAQADDEAQAGHEYDAKAVNFFENKIRPILVEHCYECHSQGSDELGGSLLLDSADGMLVGGDSGPSIQPGDADASVLISALRYESSEMPPKGKLSDEVIGDFEKWIRRGATDPRQGDVGNFPKRQSIDWEQGQKFWAFQPLADTKTPHRKRLRGRAKVTSDSANQVAANSVTANSLDAFIDSRLSEQGLVPLSDASALVRLRRLAFDLTGLPPSIELQNQWLAEPTPEKWAEIADRLLASPAFGEHWARHWMDVARYADSNGSDFNATHHEAFRYRDYLIRSFAKDAPFDKMIRQQIAGDLLPSESESQRHDNLVAATFLMLGPKMLSERDKRKLQLDVVDEQIDTIGRAFMGLTLGCARCHDHKFDPIPTEDYYALAGIFKSTVTLKGESQKYVSTWNRQKLPVPAELDTAWKAYNTKIDSFDEQIEQTHQQVTSLRGQLPGGEGAIVVDDEDAKKTGNWTRSKLMKDHVGAGYVHDGNSNKGESSIEFRTMLPSTGTYEIRMAHSGGSSRADAVPVTIGIGDRTLEAIVNQQNFNHQPMWSTVGTYPWTGDLAATVTIGNAGTSGYVIADAIMFLRKDSQPSLDSQDDGSDSEAERAVAALKAKLEAAESKLAKLQEEKKQWVAGKPSALPEAMAPTDRPTGEIADSRVHIRGEVRNLGESVPRGFLQVCSAGSSDMGSSAGSGRLQLAEWLTDPDHPLVSRVFVNRVWMHLMGEGIVRTVDNFGAQGDRPSHPKLLDYLATEFIRGGWHVKPLIRKIVLSSAYSRASDLQPDGMDVDPENRLLWRAHRRRLPAESIRDSMLFVAGQLDRNPSRDLMRKHGVLVSSNNANSKATFDSVGGASRSIYLPTVRGYLPELMRALDVADPDLLVGKRPTTNVPQQALVLINSPDINRWAGLTAKRIISHSAFLDQQTDYAWQLCLNRLALQQDHQFAAQILLGDGAGKRSTATESDWQQLVAVLLASTEFRLLD